MKYFLTVVTKNSMLKVKLLMKLEVWSVKETKKETVKKWVTDFGKVVRFSGKIFELG